MGLTADKSNVFTSIGSFTSFNKSEQQADGLNTISSVDNNDSPLPFLLDVLSVVSGGNALRDTVSGLFIDIGDDANNAVKGTTKAQTIQYNADDDLPNYFTTTPGVSFDRKVIDIYGKYKINPNNLAGKLVYGNNTNSFDYKMYDAINAEGSDVIYQNLIIKYNSNTDSFSFRKNPSSSSEEIGEYFDELIENTTIIDNDVFVPETLNNIFGGVSANTNKSFDEILNEKKINKLLNNYLDGGEFSLSDNDMLELTKEAENLKRGVNSHDFGCGINETTISLDKFDGVVDLITTSNDVNDVGDVLDDVLVESFNGSDDIFNDNSETIKNGYYVNIIDSIKSTLINMSVLSPFNRFVMLLSKKFATGDDTVGDVEDSLDENSDFIDCISNDVNFQLHKFIYELVLSLIPPLIKPIIRKIIMEKINSYIAILKGLVSL